MLGWYIININNGIKEPSTRGYQNCNTSQTLIFGDEYESKSIFAHLSYYWVKTILNHIDTRTISPKYERSCIVYRLELCPIPIPYWY